MPVDLIKRKIGGKKVTALKDAGIEDYTKTAKYWGNLGDAYVEAGLYGKAIESYKQAIRIKPDNAFAHMCHYLIGVSYVNLGMYREAIEAFKQAIRIEPDFAEAHHNLGSAYDRLGMYREAVEAYKQAIRIKPDFAEAHYWLGITYLMLGDKGSALEEYKILKDLDKKIADMLFNAIYK